MKISKKNNNISKFELVFFGCLGVVIFAIAFNHFSLWNFKGLNSDHAIHILMAENFSFKTDLYYWGQDRLGSFLPMIGSLFVLMGINSFDALGITQGLVLAMICLLIWRMRPDLALIITVMTVLLLPIFPFWIQISIGHPYLSQFLFILFSVFLLYAPVSLRWKALLLPLFFSLAVWCSELSIAAIIALILLNWKQVVIMFIRNYTYFTFSTILGIVLILIAKNNSSQVEAYSAVFASFHDIFLSFQNQFNEISGLLTGDTNKPFNQLLLYSLIFVTLFLLTLTIIYRPKISKYTWSFFLISLFSYLAIHLSGWNTYMNLPNRYFTMSYFFYCLSLIFLNYDLRAKPWSYYIVNILLVGVTINASVQFDNQFQTGANDRVTKHQAEQIILLTTNFENDSIGVIGSYWNSYIFDALSDRVVAIPRQGDHHREKEAIRKRVFNQNKFVFIGNGWLEEYPDTLVQFGHTFTKLDEELFMENISFQYYLKN